MTIDISIIICTKNRSSDVREAILSIWGQPVSAFIRYELIVVDDHSTDDTRSVINDLLNRSPIKMRLISDPPGGLSAARNAGAYAARGRVLAFMDDDAEASQCWIESLWEEFSRHPKVSVIGGKTLLKWIGKRPAWISTHHERYLSGLDLGVEYLQINSPEIVVGANFSCLKEAWKLIGGFSNRFTLYGDERYFCSRVLARGGLIGYSSKAWVWHKVNPLRQKRRYFIKRAFMQGIADAKYFDSRNVKSANVRVFVYRLVYCLKKVSAQVLMEPRSVTEFSLYSEISYLCGRSFNALVRERGI